MVKGGAKKLDEFFNPRSIAVIGASDDPSSVGYGVMKNIFGGGFKGKVYPVNIKRKKVWGRESYESVLKISNDVTLAVVATPAKTVVGIIDECGRKKIKNVIVMSSGFKEVGKEGIEMSEEMLKVARKYDLRIMGPNCMGFLRPHMNLNLSFANESPKKGNVAFISQSGALGSATLDWAKKHEFGFSFFVSLGSMIDVGFSEVMEFLRDDPQTNSILIYMESLDNAQRFIEAARKTTEKPIFVIKSGRSEQGARAALSHTGNLAGNDDAFNAAFERAGIVRVKEMDELFDCARTLAGQKIPKGNRLAIVTNAGGPGVLSTDMLIELGGEIAKLSEKTIQDLNKSLPKNWSKGNPVDVLGDAQPQDYKTAIEACLNDNGVDGVLAILTPQSMTDSVKIAEGIAKVRLKDKPIFVSFMGGDSVSKGTEILEKKKIPVFVYPERAVKVFVNLYNQRKAAESASMKFATDLFKAKKSENKKLIEQVVNEGRFTLSESEAKEILSNYSIPVAKHGVARNLSEAIAVAKQVGFPVAMKILSPDILHKTDVGGVVLDVKNDAEVKEAYRKIMSNVEKKVPKARVDGVIIEEMSSKEYELIIGCKKDPIFGKVVVFGSGGVGVDVFRDIAIGIVPLDKNLARRLMEKTKIYKLLKGYRGMPGADIEKLQTLLCRLSQLAMDLPEIKEIDINPFEVDSAGGVVLDAKIVLDEEYIKKKSDSCEC